MSKKIYGPITLTLTALLFSGCVLDNGSTISMTSEQLCEVVGIELAEEVVGSTIFTSPNPDLDTPGASGCRFTDTEINGHYTKNFNVVVIPTKSREEAEEAFNGIVERWESNQLSQRTSSKPENIADEAYWSYTEEAPQLVTRQSKYLVIVTLGQLFDEEESVHFEKANKVLDKVLDRIAAG